MITRTKKIVFSFILFLFAVTVFEVGVLVIHTLVMGKSFSREYYVAEMARIGAEFDRWGKGTEAFREVLHPYLGYVVDPTGHPEVSKHGFACTEKKRAGSKAIR